MLLTGTEKCIRCGKDNEWEYQIPQSLELKMLWGDILDDTKRHPTKVRHLQQDEYMLQFRCKYCGALNKFTVKSEEPL